MEGSERSSRTDIRVLLADDQPLLRRSLQVIIDSEPDILVVGGAGTGAETVDAARALNPNVVVMDIRMPHGDGIEATRQIVADPGLTATRILVLSMFELDEYVYGALQAGASGFLLKDGHPAQLTDAIRRIHGGESLFAPAILTKLIGHYLGNATPKVPASLSQLTAREGEVLTLIARGLANDEIARDLSVSINTVKTHVRSLLTKLDARDRTQLVVTSYQHGLVTVPGSRSAPT